MNDRQPGMVRRWYRGSRAARWAVGFAGATGFWTLMVLGYIRGSQGGSEDLNVGNMTEEWAIIGVPLLVLAALLFALSLWPRSPSSRS
jgi:hypothetical protein